MMKTQSHGRGRNSKRSCGTSTPKSREKRVAEIVKSVFTKAKEKLHSSVSGSLLVEEETALDQLEKLYLTKFLHVDEQNGLECGQDSSSQQFYIKLSQDDHLSPTASLTSPRRDSDASASNDTYLSYGFSKKGSTKERDYFGKNLWCRQWQRRKRLESRKIVRPLSIRTDEARGFCLVHAVTSMYHELLQQGKPPLAAYDLLIATLRSCFIRDTWPELVEAYVGHFIGSNILSSPEELSIKYARGERGLDHADKINEYKLQVLLHLFVLSLDADYHGDNENKNLGQVLRFLTTISVAFGGFNALDKFLDEEVLDSFLDTIPQRLTYLYEELGVPLPIELQPHAISGKSKKKKKENSVKSTLCDSTPKAVKPVSGDMSEAKSVKRCNATKRKCSSTEKPTSGVKINAKKAKVERCSKKEEAMDQVGEDDGSEKKSIDRVLAKRKLSDQVPVNKSVASIPAVLVSVLVRQSPRHHASTRALYGSAASSVSLLLQKERHGEARNGCLVLSEASTTTDLSNETTRLVLVKKKRGYFLKKFLDDDGNAGVRSTKGFAAGKSATKNVKKTRSPVKLVFRKASDTGKPKRPVSPMESTPTNIRKRGRPKKERAESDGSSNTCENKPSPVEQTDVVKKSKTNSSLVSPLVRQTSHERSVAKESGCHDIPKLKKESGSQNSRSNFDPKSPPRSPPKLAPSVITKSTDVSSKSTKSKPVQATKRKEADYDLPSFAVDNYVKYVSDIRRERKRARNDPLGGEELFYARGTRRYSIFYDGDHDDAANTTMSLASKCYSDEQMAPKNRSGRKMKSSVGVFHLASYLLNVQNQNPSAPAIPKNLQQALNTPIRLYKKLRLASKSSRRRSSKQFCALKFNADEFKLSDRSSGTCASSMVSDERSTAEMDDCASLELNCSEAQMESPKSDDQRRRLTTVLTVDTRLAVESPRRNSVSVCAGLARRPSQTWNGGLSSLDCDPAAPKQNYFLRRRRLFSDGHVSTTGSSLISPNCNGTKSMTTRWDEAKMKSRDVKFVGTKELVGVNCKNGFASRIVAANGIAERGLFLKADISLRNGVLRDHAISPGEVGQGDAFLNGLSPNADGLLQLANSSLLCTGLNGKNYAHVSTSVR